MFTFVLTTDYSVTSCVFNLATLADKTQAELPKTAYNLYRIRQQRATNAGTVVLNPPFIIDLQV